MKYCTKIVHSVRLINIIGAYILLLMRIRSQNIIKNMLKIV